MKFHDKQIFEKGIDSISEWLRTQFPEAVRIVLSVTDTEYVVEVHFEDNQVFSMKYKAREVINKLES